MMSALIEIKELHIHFDGVERVLQKLAAIEANLKEYIMATKDEVLAAVSAETQEVLDKINADRAEIDAAQAALVTATAELEVKAAAIAAAEADIAAKAEQIVALQARIDELIAAGGDNSAAFEEIKAAVSKIFEPTPVVPA